MLNMCYVYSNATHINNHITLQMLRFRIAVDQRVFSKHRNLGHPLIGQLHLSNKSDSDWMFYLPVPILFRHTYFI